MRLELLPSLITLLLLPLSFFLQDAATSGISNNDDNELIDMKFLSFTFIIKLIPSFFIFFMAILLAFN